MRRVWNSCGLGQRRAWLTMSAILFAVVTVAVIGFKWTGASSSPASAVTVVTASFPQTTPFAIAERDRAGRTDRCGTQGTIRTVAEFAASCGDPPDATMGRMRIPSIGVDAPLGERIVALGGDMPLPSGPTDVVWYDLSAWAGLGGKPGTGGNAVFAGHVDYADPVPYAQASYRGHGVFYSLSVLTPGDVIEVETGRTLLRYRVLWRRNVVASGPEWAAIMSSDQPADSITLLTCGGTFDAQTREYSHRTVVRAVRDT